MSFAAKILVADDDPFNLRLLQELCEAAGHRVVVAADGGQVLDVVAREVPDLILLDVMMPVRDGFQVLEILKNDAALKAIPVILVTAAGDHQARSRGIELGAEDYVTKPYRIFEIQQRIRNALRLRAAEGELARVLETARAYDPLTEVGTSQQLVISSNYEITRAARFGHQLTCLAVCIANFAEVLQAVGSERADQALVGLSGALKRTIRNVDQIFRADLDEFAILLPETDKAGAEAVIRRLVQTIHEEQSWTSAQGPIPVLSVGFAIFPQDVGPAADELLRFASRSIAPLDPAAR